MSNFANEFKTPLNLFMEQIYIYNYKKLSLVYIELHNHIIMCLRFQHLTQIMYQTCWFMTQ